MADDKDRGAGEATGKATGKAPPQVIVNMSEAERAFPIGSYSAVLDKEGSPGHSIKGRYRIMPGMNLRESAVIGQARGKLDDDAYAQVAKHPDFKRLVDVGAIRLFDSRKQIPRPERATIAALTIDMAVLEEWHKVEDDTATKVAIAAQMKQLRDDGLDQGDQQVAQESERVRPGQDIVL